jgi:hypothetical protein
MFTHGEPSNEAIDAALVTLTETSADPEARKAAQATLKAALGGGLSAESILRRMKKRPLFVPMRGAPEHSAMPDFDYEEAAREHLVRMAGGPAPVAKPSLCS